MRSVTSSVEAISPIRAKQYLGNQVNNRAVVKPHVEWLASLMRRGEFKVAQPISFDAKGRLLDGQHRLLAVIAADTAVPMLVVRGVEADTFSVMDTGRARKGSDVLSIKGRAQTQLLSATLRLVWQDELDVLGSMEPKHRPSNADILDRDDEHPEIGDSVIQAVGRGNFTKNASIAFLYWRSHRANKAVADAFWPGVITGEGLRKRTPQYLLYNLLIEQKQDGRRLAGKELLAYAIKAWNFMLLPESDCPAMLRWAAGTEDFPRICATRAEAEQWAKGSRAAMSRRKASVVA